MTDDEIVRAVLEGDGEAYTALVDRYRKIVYGLAYHHLEVPVTTIKSRLRNARARLRKEWIRMTEETLDAQAPTADFTRQIMAFFEAVRANNVERVRQFVTAHPALVHRRYIRRDGTWEATEADDARAETALHFAAFHGYVALARVLLDHGADVNAANHDGCVPLELAAWEGGIEVLRTILESGPELSRSGTAALETAAAHGARDRCELLLAHGAEPDLPTAIMLGMTDRARALLDADASLRDLLDRRGRTPLDVAVERGERAIAEMLIARGAAVNVVQAAGLGMLEAVRAEIERDASLLNPTDGSETPLMAAARNGHVAVMEYLLARGADVHLGQVEYIHRILPIHVASAAAVDTLVAAGADVNVPYRGFTPLQRALSRGDDALVEALRRHGGLRCLYLQCAIGRLEMVESLIRLGADVNEADEQGRTPLALTLAKAQDAEVRDPGVGARYAAIAELLRQHGAVE